MIKRLKELFSGAAVKAVGEKTDDVQIATAALLIEAAMSDEDYSDTEKETIITVLQRHFSLNAEEAASVIKEAEEAHSKSDQLLYFTRTVKENFPLEDRVEIIEMMWEIAYADGVLSKFEANLVRRICGLIYVSDVDSGNARKRVLKTLKIAE